MRQGQQILRSGVKISGSAINVVNVSLCDGSSSVYFVEGEFEDFKEEFDRSLNLEATASSTPRKS